MGLGQTWGATYSPENHWGRAHWVSGSMPEYMACAPNETKATAVLDLTENT